MVVAAGGVADVVIVGNGAIGLTMACALRRAAPSLTVTVVGPRGRAGGATAAAGAMLGCFGEVTKTTLASPAGRAKFDLARASHDLWPDHLTRLMEVSEAPIVRARGTFLIQNARSGRLDDHNVRALIGALDQFAVPYQEVDDVPGLFPSPDARPLRTFFLPDEDGIDARCLLGALERQAEALGVVQVHDVACEVLGGRRGAAGVRLQQEGRIAAGAVAVVAGAFSTPLLDTIVDRATVQPVLAGSGYAFVARRTQGLGFTSVVRSVNRAGSCGLHVVPLGGGTEYFGATNVVFGSPVLHPHLGATHFLIDCVIDQLDQRASYSKLTQPFVGNRPVPLDTFPLFGPSGIDNLFLFTGTYRDGLHASPLIAEMAARLIIDSRNEFDPILSPTRRPISVSSVEQSIDEFVEQRISSTFESRTTLSQFMDHEDLRDIFRPRAERLYEKLGWEEGLATDMLDFLVMNSPSAEDFDRIREYLHALGRPSHDRGLELDRR